MPPSNRGAFVRSIHVRHRAQHIDSSTRSTIHWRSAMVCCCCSCCYVLCSLWWWFVTPPRSNWVCNPRPSLHVYKYNWHWCVCWPRAFHNSISSCVPKGGLLPLFWREISATKSTVCVVLLVANPLQQRLRYSGSSLTVQVRT